MDFEKVYKDSMDKFYEGVFNEARGAMNIGDVNAEFSDESNAKRYGKAYNSGNKHLRLTSSEYDENGDIKPGTGTLTNLGLQGYIASFLDNGEVREYESVLDEYLSEDAVYSDKKQKGYTPTTTRDGPLTKYIRDVDEIYDLGNPELLNPSVKPKTYKKEDTFNYKRTAFNNARFLCAYASDSPVYYYINEKNEKIPVETDELGIRKVLRNGTEKVGIKKESVKRFLFIQTMPLALDTLFDKITTSSGNSMDYSVKNKLLTVTGDDDAGDRDTRLDYVLNLLLADGDDTEDGKGRLRGLFNEWLENSGTAFDAISRLGDENGDYIKQNPLGYLATDINLKNSNINRWDIDLRESEYLDPNGTPKKGYLIIKDWLEENLSEPDAKKEFKKIVGDLGTDENGKPKNKVPSNQWVQDYLQNHYPQLYDYLTLKENGKLVNMAKEAFTASVRNSRMIMDIGNNPRLDRNFVGEETKEVRPWLDEENTVEQLGLDSDIVLSDSAFRKDIVRDVLLDIKDALEDERCMAVDKLYDGTNYEEITFEEFSKNWYGLMDAIKEDESGKFEKAKIYKLDTANVSESDFLKACEIVKDKLVQYGDNELRESKVVLLQYAEKGTKDLDYKNALIKLLESVLGHNGKLLSKKSGIMAYSFDSKTKGNVPYLIPYPYLVALYLVIKSGPDTQKGYLTKPGVYSKDAINIFGALNDSGALAKSLAYTGANGFIKFEKFNNYPKADKILGKDYSDKLSNLDYLAAGMIYQSDFHDELNDILETIKKLLTDGGYNMSDLDNKLNLVLMSEKESTLMEEALDAYYQAVYNQASKAQYEKYFEAAKLLEVAIGQTFFICVSRPDGSYYISKKSYRSEEDAGNDKKIYIKRFGEDRVSIVSNSDKRVKDSSNITIATPKL